ncbi:MAG: hypothetical protein GQ583_06575 [Methyloprofundus sp.]|nr:hypothetical protein [Methyloprofundus sp.]
MNDRDNDIIPKVNTETLDKTIEEARKQQNGESVIDPGTKILLDQEKQYILNWRNAPAGEVSTADQKEPLNDLTGLAFSGGGIRSATFSLGIMQALAHHDLLKKFDYLSTVSGGGYIGSAITWLASDKANSESKENADHFGVGKGTFPFGADDPAPDAALEASKNQQNMLRYIRTHGNYLSPGEGISILSSIGVVLRGTLLNLIVWLPILALILMLGFKASTEFLQGKTFLWVDFDKPWLKPMLEKISTAKESLWSDKYLGYELMLQVGVAIIGILVLGVVAYSVFTYFMRARCKEEKKWLYDLRRWAEKVSPKLMIFAALAFVIASLPLVAIGIGIVAIIVGIGMHLPSFLSSVNSDKKVPIGIIVPIGAGLFLYGIFVSAFQIAEVVYAGSIFWIYVIILIPLITGYCVNLNYISFHRFYRDRLMETFMPDIDEALENSTGAAYGADCAHIQDISDIDNPKSPYHIINTNVVLVNSKNFVYKDRGGDNFILSPLYCGSNATGWQRTDKYMDGQMTLATAVAISGAAANPNSGVGGKGLTRNRILSLVMSLLNLRLGYWAHHPINTPMGINKLPNHFRPGAYSFLNAMQLLGFTENRPYLQLSDGGHFENMGVYELVRRRLKLILVCDGGADPDFSFSDFQTTIRRIEDDFGARVVVDDTASPDHVLPIEPEKPAYPPGAKFAKQGYMIAKITYADASEGKLIYLKTTLIGDKDNSNNKLSFKVKGYKAEHESFPDESTADQFFDEVQFEAYRELGFRIANQMISGSNLRDTLNNLRR